MLNYRGMGATSQYCNSPLCPLAKKQLYSAACLLSRQSAGGGRLFSVIAHIATDRTRTDDRDGATARPGILCSYAAPAGTKKKTLIHMETLFQMKRMRTICLFKYTQPLFSVVKQVISHNNN